MRKDDKVYICPRPTIIEGLNIIVHLGDLRVSASHGVRGIIHGPLRPEVIQPETPKFFNPKP